MGSSISYPYDTDYHYIEKLKTEYLELATSPYEKVCAQKEFSFLFKLAEKYITLSKYHPIHQKHMDEKYECDRNIYYALIEVLTYIITEYTILVSDVVIIATGTHEEQFKTRYKRIQKNLEYMNIKKNFIPIIKQISETDKDNQSSPIRIQANLTKMKSKYYHMVYGGPESSVLMQKNNAVLSPR